MTKKKKLFIVLTSVLSLVLVVGISYLSYFLAVILPDRKEKEEQLQKAKEYYSQKLINYSNENNEYDDYEVDVVFIGDSLTDGYNLDNYYSDTGYIVSNRGIGGDTTYGLKDRLAVSVLDLKPKVCVMLIGGNNPETMFEDYEDILITFKEQLPKTKILLVSHAPTNGEHWGSKNKLFAYNNVIIELLSKKYNYEFVDIYTPMIDLETGMMKESYTSDGAHFTAEGYVVVTNQIKPVIQSLVQNWQ